MCIKLNKHGHVDKSTKKWITKIKNHPDVIKVILGEAINVRHKFPPGEIKFIHKLPTGGGKFKTYTENGIRDIIIFANLDNVGSLAYI